MFPKKNRITKKEQFDRIFKEGTARHCDVLMMKILKNNLGIRRFGVIVSKKISSKAVERNKIKRQIRQILRQNQEKFPKSCDTVVYPKPSIKEKDPGYIEKCILRALEK